MKPAAQHDLDELLAANLDTAERLMDLAFGQSLDAMHDAIGLVPDGDTERSRDERFSYLKYQIRLARAAVERGVSQMSDKAIREMEAAHEEEQKGKNHARLVKALMEGEKLDISPALDLIAREHGDGYSRKRWYNAKRARYLET
jgi:hypothetical protein